MPDGRPAYGILPGAFHTFPAVCSVSEKLHQRLAPWQRQALLLIVFVLAAAPLVGFQALNDRKLSVYDEWQYSDRVHAVTQRATSG